MYINTNMTFVTDKIKTYEISCLWIVLYLKPETDNIHEGPTKGLWYTVILNYDILTLVYIGLLCPYMKSLCRMLLYPPQQS